MVTCCSYAVVLKILAVLVLLGKVCNGENKSYSLDHNAVLAKSLPLNLTKENFYVSKREERNDPTVAISIEEDHYATNKYVFPGAITANYVISKFEKEYETSDSLQNVNSLKGTKKSDAIMIKEIEIKEKTINIGGLFDLTGSRGHGLGESELSAAKLAVEHVNFRNVIPGYTLNLLFNDTSCDPGVGMDALYDLLYRREKILMVMGSACSEVTKTLAEIVPYWNLILVSFASTSPALSDREKYKTFFRLAPADSSHNAPRTMFIRHFNWDTVATLYESKEVYSLVYDKMGKAFEQSNITVAASISFRHADSVRDKLLELKKKDVRIIIGGFSENIARKVLCEAYKLNMYGSRYVWIMIGDYVERWWQLSNDTDCAAAALDDAADGYFTIDSLNALSYDVSVANISYSDFQRDYRENNGTRPMSPYATSTYDTVWTIALTLRGALEKWSESNSTNGRLNLDSFSYDGGRRITDTFFDVMQQLQFLGISGPISFQGPDREGIAVINQNQGGEMKRIALYEPDESDMEKLNFYCSYCEPIVWKGGRAPRDKYELRTRQKKIRPLAFYCISSVSVLGLLLAVGFLTYNLYHRKLRYIKLSSPKLNNVAVIGCMLVYMGIIIYGLDGSMLQEEYFPYICTIRAFLFAAGFSLAFGAMFTKTYRVHQIFTRANRGLIKSKLLRDKQLLFIIGALLVVDSAVVLVWVFVDPMHKQTTNLTIEASEEDTDLLFIYQLTTCHSNHMDKWTGALYAYKGLLLVFGVYMAWETRSVKIPALNDSQYIGMNVYNVVIMSVIVVVLSNILSDQPSLAYTVESSFILLSTTVTLCLLFVPKIYAIITSKGNPIIATSGITVEANCRRFVVDERRDLFYRAEVQNRVYKREIVELDQEISRLERLLELPLQPYPRLTNELLHLLPESRVDPSPLMRRRRLRERERCNSISDGGDVCMGLSEDKSDDEAFKVQIRKPSPKPLRRRASRLSFRNARNYAVNTLSKWKPRFSIGSMPFKSEYEDLQTSPSPEGQDVTDPFLVRGPLMRQQAVDERRSRRERQKMFSMQRISDKSDETNTVESLLSENWSSDDTVTDRCIPVPLFNRKPSVTSGCEEEETEKVEFSLWSSVPKRKSKSCSQFGNYLDVPSDIGTMRVTPVDSLTNHSPQLRRARSIIEYERRTRIRKLQSDLQRIQKELQDLDELEYEVSHV